MELRGVEYDAILRLGDEPEPTPRHPMQRFATPEEVAKTIAFLCSDQASYITGQVLKMGGGFLAGER